MGIWLAVAVAIAVALVFGLKAVTRKSFEKGREALELPVIQASVADRISPNVFNEVWLKVGEAYSIDPRLIRPDDTLKKLSEIDSWDLGKGGDAINAWLKQKGLGAPPSLHTVLDIARWIDASGNKAA